ncbi:hypothetical protein [Haloferax massiliensis]|uniref:hypothetical protein n=1 Tax=Haloferax massiliensis TaxID=1476858 RepID=UPI000B7D27DE|nr:hypothetical protein [Haloferax massiliensis]
MAMATNRFQRLDRWLSDLPQWQYAACTGLVVFATSLGVGALLGAADLVEATTMGSSSASGSPSLRSVTEWSVCVASSVVTKHSSQQIDTGPEYHCEEYDEDELCE